MAHAHERFDLVDISGDAKVADGTEVRLFGFCLQGIDGEVISSTPNLTLLALT